MLISLEEKNANEFFVYLLCNLILFRELVLLMEKYVHPCVLIDISEIHYIFNCFSKF